MTTFQELQNRRAAIVLALIAAFLFGVATGQEAYILSLREGIAMALREAFIGEDQPLLPVLEFLVSREFRLILFGLAAVVAVIAVICFIRERRIYG